MNHLLRATLNSMNGFCSTVRTEAAFRQELVVLVLAVPLAFLVVDGIWRRMALIGVVVSVLVVELLNTTIEKLADCVTSEHNDSIKRVKDTSSAACSVTQL